MTREELKNQIFVGVVEDNEDPQKIGRIKVRVMNVYEDIPKEDLPWATPWKDLNGNMFILPEIGKVVSVVFDDGNPYKPEYIFAQHYNQNLQDKLDSLSTDDYTSMRALMFDHKTQIFSNDSEGLKIDYKFNNINITKSEINVNLKDNFGHVNIGTPTANQQAILGNNFLNWFDTFVDNLLGANDGPYIGNLGSPVVANPELIDCLNQYKALKDPKFLSHQVNIVDNDMVETPDRITNAQIGDTYKSTDISKIAPQDGPNPGKPNSGVDFAPQKGLSTDTPDGDLTSHVDSNGNVVNPADGNTQPPAIVPSNHPDVDKILNAMNKFKYTILTRPYEVNIVGIRRQYEGMKYSNVFVDDLYAIYKTDNSSSWNCSRYKISTMPGYYSAYVASNGKLKRDPTGKSPNVKQSSVMLSRGTPPNNGMGILMPSQYLNIYQIGEHCSAPAMKTKGPQKFYRDNSVGDTIKYTGQGQGQAGMLIHRGYKGGSAVNNWSEGCQVFSSESELKSFFTLCNKHKDLYGNNFHYTLMLEKDLG